MLIVPGGLGTSSSKRSVEEAIQYIRKAYSTLKYLLTVSTGSGLAVRAGVLDGKRAITNKMAWAEITALGPKVEWVSHVRWVTDGKVWSSSGVSAGIDAMLAWIGTVIAEEFAQEIANGVEQRSQLRYIR